MMKILCLLDETVQAGHRWLWNYLPGNNDEVEFLTPATVSDRFQKWGKIFNYYPAFWQLGLRALIKTRQTPYDIVVAWEGKNGFPYAFLRSLVGQKSPPLINVSFNLRGVISHFPMVVRFALRSVARVVVLTSSEVEYYQRTLSLAPEAISYCPLGWYDAMEWYDPNKGLQSEGLTRGEKFIYTSGRSYRDYETLARAIEGTEVNVKVSGRAFNLAGLKLPGSMKATGWLTYRELHNYIFHSQFYVLPLQAISHACGETSMLHAMSFGKAIVATRAPGTETYIEHGVTGLLVEPGDVEGMQQAILRLWRNPGEANQMGQAARRRFEENHTIQHLAQRVYRIALEVYQAQGGWNEIRATT